MGLHGRETKDLEEVGHHHVPIGARGFVETGPPAKAQGLGHVDLNMVDEVSIPDRLEEAIGETKGQDVLSRLLAQEMIDTKNLLFGEDFMQLGVQPDRAFKVGAERLLHYDPRAVHKIGVPKQAHRGQGGLGRHAEIMQPAALAPKRQLGVLHGGAQGLGARGHRHIVQNLREGAPSREVEGP